MPPMKAKIETKFTRGKSRGRRSVRKGVREKVVAAELELAFNATGSAAMEGGYEDDEKLELPAPFLFTEEQLLHTFSLDELASVGALPHLSQPWQCEAPSPHTLAALPVWNDSVETALAAKPVPAAKRTKSFAATCGVEAKMPREGGFYIAKKGASGAPPFDREGSFMRYKLSAERFKNRSWSHPAFAAVNLVINKQ